MAIDFSQRVLATGNTPWGGKWFIVNLKHTESRVDMTGEATSTTGDWWNKGLQQNDEEALTTMYMELDPPTGRVTSKLLSTREKLPVDEERRAAAIQEAQQAGEESGFYTEMYLYEATTNVSLPVAAAMLAWGQQPYDPGFTDREWERVREMAFHIRDGEMWGVEMHPQSPTQVAINTAVTSAIEKWKQAPVFSGQRLRIPDETLLDEESEVAVRIFDVDTGFYGIEP
jgi:hypothetical protein